MDKLLLTPKEATELLGMVASQARCKWNGRTLVRTHGTG